jgi:hypothetical protein
MDRTKQHRRPRKHPDIRIEGNVAVEGALARWEFELVASALARLAPPPGAARKEVDDARDAC